MDFEAKHAVLRAVILQIENELATMTRIAREAAEAVSHEENRAEGNKDMRSTEASYIAHGQAERAVELERSRVRLAALNLARFTEDSTVESSALVQLQHHGQVLHYFVLPVGGGRKISHAGVTVHTVTPTSPLGSALLGMGVGDEVEVSTPAAQKVYEVLAIV